MQDETLVSVIDGHFKNQPDHPAQHHKVNGQWVDISYGELGRVVYEIAAGLRALGIAKGDRVSLLSENRVEWASCDLGIIFAGATCALMV